MSDQNQCRKKAEIIRKNILDFCGKPIMSYSIDAALGSGVFDKVMVSTEDEEIASVAREYGAEVPFLRSEKTSDDYATTSDVLCEVIEEYEKIGESFDMIACIYPTAPFIDPGRLKDAVNTLRESKADSLVPVVRFSYPPQRALKVEDGHLKFIYPEHKDSRSQDLMPHYHDAGQFYVFRRDSFMKNREIIAGKVMPM